MSDARNTFMRTTWLLCISGLP